MDMSVENLLQGYCKKRHYAERRSAQARNP
jgi:hypothetical protein